MHIAMLLVLRSDISSKVEVGIREVKWAIGGTEASLSLPVESDLQHPRYTNIREQANNRLP
jgi:hypothetical protein